MEMQTSKNPQSEFMKERIAEMYIGLNSKASKIAGQTGTTGIVYIIEDFRADIAEIINLACFNEKFEKYVEREYRHFLYNTTRGDINRDPIKAKNRTVRFWRNISRLLRKTNLIVIRDRE